MQDGTDVLNVHMARTADAICGLTRAVDDLGEQAFKDATLLEEARCLLHRLHDALLPGFLHEEGCDCEDDGDCQCQDLAAFKRIMQGWTPPEGVATSYTTQKET